MHLVVVAVVVGAVCSMRLAMGLFAFPVVDGDGVFFWPSALSYARGQGLTNAFLPRAAELDPAGEGRLVHGFLHQIVLGFLAPEATPMALHVVESALQIVAIALSAWSFLRLSDRYASTVWRGIATTSAAVLAVASPLVGLTGRPETLAMLFVAAGLAVMVVTPRRRASWAVAGALLGLTAVTDPAVAMVATGVLAVCASAHLSPRAAVCRLVVACATGAGIVLGLALALYPYGLGFWIAGLRRHASLTTGFSESGLAGIPAYWLADTRSPFLLLTLGLALHGVIRTVFPGDAAPRTAGRWSRVAALSAAAAIGAYTIGHRPEQVYYAMSLMPLWCAMIIAGRPGGCTARLGQGMPRRELIGVLVLLLAGSGFLLAILQFQGYLRHGLALPEARSLFARMRDAHPGRVSVTSALWALADDPATLLLYEGHPERARASDVVIVQQANSGRLEPPELPGLAIVEDRFVRERPRVLAVPYGRAIKSYAFCGYRAYR